MKKLYSLAFYVLFAPAITLGSGALLAAPAGTETKDLGEQSMGHEAEGEMQSQDSTKSSYNSTQAAQETGDESGMQNKGYIASPPANGMAASDLIGTDLKTSGDESVGEVSDLIIDQDGKVVAVVVKVGAFLGMGEKQVAIYWDAVTGSGNPDDPNLRVDMTRDDLQSATSYQQLDESTPNPPSNFQVE